MQICLTLRVLAVVSLLAMLTACGGSGGSEQNTETPTLSMPDENTAQVEPGISNPDGSGDTGDTDNGRDSEMEPANESPESPTVIVPGSPPFSGTIFVDPDIITADDPSAFQSIHAQGKGERHMFDRRVGWITTTPFLFQATYDDDLSIEIQVNPEFTEVEATDEAQRYAQLFGQLPTLLRKDVETSWIHKGVNPWGGGNRNLLVHTGQAELYFQDGIAEETLIHEASHTSLDTDYATSAGWIAAQHMDSTFISTYAQDFPAREDIAESFLPYVALRYRRDRISDELASLFEVTMPNRIQFFDSVVRDMYPLE